MFTFFHALLNSSRGETGDRKEKGRIEIQPRVKSNIL